MRLLSCALPLILMTSLSQLAYGQAYPTRPVRLIVAFAPGGPIDLLARPVSQKLTESLGQPFVIDFRTGGNGIIGTEHVAKSAPDGYTLQIFSSGHTINPSTQRFLPYDTLKDFTAISPVARSEFVLVVNPKLAVNSVGELVALAKSKPGALNFSSSGTGGALHLSGEFLKLTANIQMTHIPYKGAAPALLEVVAGNVDLAFVAAPPAIPQIKAGKVRVIGIASQKRWAHLPDVPTIDEQGYPGFEVTAGYGLIAPAGTARSVVGKLNETMERMLSGSEVLSVLAKMGLDPWHLKPEQLQVWLTNDVQKWQRVTKAIKYEPD